MMGVLLFVAVLLVAVGGIVVGWVLWISQAERFRAPKWRSVVALVGLLAATLQVAVFILFEGYAVVAGSFSYRARNIFVWGRVDSCICATALLAALFGKGRIRAPVALSAVAIEVIWFALAMAL